ncbi:MAG: flavin reductase family protein [Pseudomonadota bacterium]
MPKNRSDNTEAADVVDVADVAVSIDPRDLRTALSQFATGVCIVAANGVAQHPAPFAITVNSFASVSLAPPLVLWSVQKSSTTYPYWLETDTFGISVLNAGQAALCERYAIRDNHTMPTDETYALSAAGNPLITDAIATFDCSVDALHDAGDHTIIVARVDALVHDVTQEPLIYFRGDVRASS